MSRYGTRTRIGFRPERYPQPHSIKPMDISIISREAIRKNVARIAIERGGDIEAAIRIYAPQLNLTEDTIRDVMAFVEEEQAS